MISQHTSRTSASMVLLGAVWATIFSAAACSNPEAAVVSENSQVQGGAYRLEITINTGGRLSAHPVLLVALHGDLGTGYENVFAAREVADEALLVSCPCDVDAWREHMLRRTRFAGFQGKIDTLSPIDQLRGVRVPVTLIVGTNDNVAPPVLSERYRDTGVKLGKSIRLLKLDGKDHEIFLDPGVFAALAPMLD